MAVRRRTWVIGFITLGGLVTAVLIALAGRIPFSSDTLRQRVEATLESRMDAEVELGELTIRFFPAVRVRGGGLAIRHKGRRDVPPLISVNAFTVDADLIGLWNRRVRRVSLDGLDIQIPPGQLGKQDVEKADDNEAQVEPEEADYDSYIPSVREVVIKELVADEAKLTIIPRNPEKRAKVWQLHKLTVNNVGAGQEMPYRTVMTNAVPPGRIDTSGAFGPWATEEPGRTPINGAFTFDRADLSYFKGIAGILSAKGRYEGALSRIEVRGETETPDFTVKVGGHPVPLTTKYHSIVDGTNGDTTLERIDATFLKTSLVARGGVFDVKGGDGRLVTLDIEIEEGRLEDIMTLAVNTPKPPMTGAIHLETKFDLPPGDKDVVDKLLLNGRFGIKGGRFTNREVAVKIAELSRKARIDDDEKTPAPASVASDFSGRFSLGNGVLALPIVTFDVPGAAVRLTGRYGLESENIDFVGSLYMDAKISQTTTGWKSLLLKMVDPLFRRDGKTVVPIKIQGTRNAPAFGLDAKRVFNRDDPVAPPKTKPVPPKPAPPKPAPTTKAKPEDAKTKAAASTSGSKKPAATDKKSK